MLLQRAGGREREQFLGRSTAPWLSVPHSLGQLGVLTSPFRAPGPCSMDPTHILDYVCLSCLPVGELSTPMVTPRRWSSGREGGLFPVGAGGVPCPSDHSSPPPSLPAPGDRGRGWQLSCQTAAPHYSSGTASKLPAGFLFTLSLGSKTSSTSAIDRCILLITNCYLRLPQIFCLTMTALVVVSCRSCSLSHALSSVCLL